MKRILVFLLLLLLPLLFLSATDTLGEKGEQKIIGFVDMVHSLNVTPEEANNPFDVTGRDVQRNDGVTGLRIGSWSVLTNYSGVTLTIVANPLTLSTDSSDAIPYELGVQYPDTATSTAVCFVDCVTTPVPWEKGAYPLPTYPLSSDENDRIASCTDMGLYIRIRTSPDDITVGTYNGTISFTLTSM